MAIINCEIHGRSGCYSVCPHIIEAKLDNTKIEKVITMSFYFGDFAGNPNAPMTFSDHYCQKCVEIYGFPEESHQFSEENVSEDELDKKFEYTSDKFKLVCGNCYVDFMNEAKISKSKEVKR